MTAGPAWWELAACAGAPVEWFFEEYRANRDSPAAVYCRTCPVTQRCLSDALRVESLSDAGPRGFRGGMSAVQRRELVRQQSHDLPDQRSPEPDTKRVPLTAAAQF